MISPCTVAMSLVDGNLCSFLLVLPFFCLVFLPLQLNLRDFNTNHIVNEPKHDLDAAKMCSAVHNIGVTIFRAWLTVASGFILTLYITCLSASTSFLVHWGQSTS